MAERPYVEKSLELIAETARLCTQPGHWPSKAEMEFVGREAALTLKRLQSEVEGRKDD